MPLLPGLHIPARLKREKQGVATRGNPSGEEAAVGNPGDGKDKAVLLFDCRMGSYPPDLEPG